MTRRRFLIAAGAGGLGLLALRFGIPRLLRPGPARPLSGEAEALARSCFAGIDRSRMWDAHVHVIGLGTGETGCWFNPEAQSRLHPIKKLQYDLLRSSIGMTRPEHADADYVERLFALHRLANPAGKLVLMAFDYHVDENGVEVPELSPFYTPNEYVLRLASENEDALACASIHPYRKDAVSRLEAVYEAGARAIKWLPNSMGIDPASERCEPFYRRLAEMGLPLLTHGGEEYAVGFDLDQEYGNPLRLRRALDAGVKVIVAHCASFGTAVDLDASEVERAEMDAFDLFLRLLDEKQYEKTLFADISTLNQINRSGRPLREMLKATRYHHRLVNGSDYPLPTVKALFSTSKLRYSGYLTGEESRLCGEIHDANPLLFDFVVKRSLKVEEQGKVYRFAPHVFETASLFEPSIPAAAV